ncbi:MAG TPA: hypothetical protein VMC62_03585 [Longilinea sp.]|nr:hypothetical protein [Longilinea sp.]
MPEKTTRTMKDDKLEEAREHMRAAHENMHKVMEAWIPEGVRENRRVARREFLLGLRSLLDAAIEHTEK